jgi:hypothetical protein
LAVRHGEAIWPDFVLKLPRPSLRRSPMIDTWRQTTDRSDMPLEIHALMQYCERRRYRPRRSCKDEVRRS